MEKKEKELLLRDLSARLPYNVYIYFKTKYRCNAITDMLDGAIYTYIETHLLEDDGENEIDIIKPYLRPMSSMTEEEMQDAREKFFEGSDHYDIDDIGEIYADTGQPYTSIYTLSFVRLFGYVDWLNAHHFDYRGLIGKGLAIEITKENNPYES
jgi:hypothetical protein